MNQKMVPFNICKGSLNSRQSDVVTNEGIGAQFLKVQVIIRRRRLVCCVCIQYVYKLLLIHRKQKGNETQRTS